MNEYRTVIGEALLDKQSREGRAVSFTFYNGRRIPIMRGGMAQGDNVPARLGEWAGVGTTYYVDVVNGLDSRTEPQAQNIATPWQTLMKVKTSYVKPAVGYIRVLIRAGTYRGASSAVGVAATLELWGLGARAPDATHLLIWEAYPGETVTIQEPAYSGGTPETSERHGIWMDDSTASFTRVRGCVIAMAGAGTVNQSQGFRIDSDVANFEISRCEIKLWRSAATSGVDRSQGIFCDGNNGQFYDLDMHDNGDAVTESPGASHGAYCAGSAHHLLFINCKSNDNRNGFGIQFFAAGGGANNIITHCTLTNNKMSGVVVDGSTWTVDVRNCIIVDNDEWAVTVRNGATCISRYNNTYLNLAGSLGDGYDVGTGGGTHTVSNKIVGDPLFTNYAGKNFHLSAGTPAYNAGVIEYTPPKDYDQTNRLAPTLGVYVALEEYGVPKAGTDTSGTATESAFASKQLVGSDSSGTTTETATLVMVDTPFNVQPPSVTGAPNVGVRLSVDPGHWDTPVTAYYWQWQRSNDGVGGWENIPGANENSYVPIAADTGKFIRVREKVIY